ncbi:alpha/beta fold hydrolase [Brucellaceae bacterium C25G]
MTQDGFRLHYQLNMVHPNAPWLVFGNSLMTDISIWDDLMPVLSGQWNILRYDQRGHGRSDVPQSPLDIDRLAQDLLVIIECSGIKSCTYIGLSMGVSTGLAAYASRPDMFEKLILVDGQARSAATGRLFWEDRITLAKEHGMEALADQTVPRWLGAEGLSLPSGQKLHQMIMHTSVAGFAACASALREYNETAILPLINVPVHLIAGENDSAIAATMQSMVADIPDATFTLIADAGHIPNFERPQAFADVLLKCLGNVQNQSGLKS